MDASQPNLPGMYAAHQRNSSNPRPYAAPDASGQGVSGEQRRDDAHMYGGQESYASYQGGYASGGGGYPYSSNSLTGYTPTTAASGSRKTSGPGTVKPATPPTNASASVGNPSPSSRYYTAQPSSATESSHLPTQSPYQSTSAPPQATHHQISSQNQPQTARPYSGYQGYYNQNQQYSGQYYPTPQTGRPSQAGSASTTTPTMSHNATMSDTSHPHRTPTSATYDYSYSWQHDPNSARTSSDQWQQQQQQRAPVQGINPSNAMPQQWQYAHQMPQSIPPHQMQHGQVPAGGQYSWQQQQWPQNFYPPAQQQAQLQTIAPHQSSSSPVIGNVPAGGKKTKKEKKEKPEKVEGEQVLGKRHAESGTEEEGDEKKDMKKKKGKKEEEKPTPKPPAKSHLHPPRQAQSAWQLFFTDELNKAKAAATTGHSPGGTPQHAKLNVAQIAKDAGAAYAQLDQEQKAYYAQKVQESKEQYAKDLAAWQATLTPEDIRVENAFRAQQRKEGKSRKGNLKDPNAPKKPLSAYFLFLKGIREDSALRAKVWGEEQETTKQSVLAAERWRSLSDEEKKPFLQQAEKDKQEYEAARKIYEDDAAARARGEDVPDRPLLPHVSSPVTIDLKSIREEPKQESPTARQALHQVEPTLAGFHHDSDEEVPHGDGSHPFESIEIDEFDGFHDPLALDLSGLAEQAGQEHGHWDALQNFMDTHDPDQEEPHPLVNVEVSKPIVAESAVLAADELDEEPDTSVAPTLKEAVAETVEIQYSADQGVEAPAPEVAVVAEGHLAVPQSILEPVVDDKDVSTPSGIPTEDIANLPPAGLPPVIDELPIDNAVQLGNANTSAEPVLPTDTTPVIEEAQPPVPMESHSTPIEGNTSEPEEEAMEVDIAANVETTDDDPQSAE
ncbi:hypothetical protein M231_03131 [Tremella mesenterica]|uniref:HMG box domain-containing protein n=1 Tax=Tremella mesenterica TaxID=5217 RepID=A0A4Q1BP36_TREME|nr:hypothetical protein M231_03131 [Tremella mesenterica]